MGSRLGPRPRVGCSGWNYKSWRGRFYPPEVPAAQWLRYYAERFDTVEVNNTFYRLPELETFMAWRTQVPRSFVMTVKASRFLTHMKKLRDPEEPLVRLFSNASGLGDRIGPVLYQLPGHMPINLERLEAFLTVLPRILNHRRMRHVMEFRHTSWYVPETFRLLERHGVALCLHDKAGSTIAEPFVGPFVYVRFHGTTGHYNGSYSDAHLDRWAHRLSEQWHEGKAVYAYFNNDPDAVATMNAKTLRERLIGRAD